MKLFGTDGIRGPVGRPPLTPECLMQIGRCAGEALLALESDSQGQKILIGRDSRASGPDFVSALATGFASCGFDSHDVGCLPSPAVALLTGSLDACLGVMVTASHNPHTDNGVKFFGPDGDKISDALEAEISARYFRTSKLEAFQLVKPHVRSDAEDRYRECLAPSLEKLDLRGCRLALDCAHGATAYLAPGLFRSLGAELVEIGTAPNGHNINQGCGATDLTAAQTVIAERRADFAIAFDGDGDRVLMVDGKGRQINGDHIIAILARDLAGRGRLPRMTAVATIMSNMGFEQHLQAHGIDLFRTPVGDRHVIAAMRTGGYAVGGEQSGHIIIADHALTGDGIAAACQTLVAANRLGLGLNEIYDSFTQWPQQLKNLPLPAGLQATDFMERSDVQDCVAASTERLGKAGRVNIRPSGTEPLLRIMVEANTAESVKAEIKQLSDALGFLLEAS